MNSAVLPVITWECNQPYSCKVRYLKIYYTFLFLKIAEGVVSLVFKPLLVIHGVKTVGTPPLRQFF